MKLKAPRGVGNPCVAGDTIVHRDGVYDVEPEIGVLLVECFGFVKIEAAARQPSRPSKAVNAARSGRQSAKKA